MSWNITHSTRNFYSQVPSRHQPAPPIPQRQKIDGRATEMGMNTGSYDSDTTLYEIRPAPSNFPSLDSMSNDELQKYLDSDQAVGEFINELPIYTEQRALRDQLNVEVEQLARRNLACKDEMENKKSYLLEQHKILQEVRSTYDSNFGQYRSLSGRFESQAILDALKIATAEADEASEDLAGKCLDGDLSIDDFLKQYFTKRTLYHMRAAKAEKLANMT